MSVVADITSISGESAAAAGSRNPVNEHRSGGEVIYPSGQSLAIRRINRLIAQVARFDSNVLILGESGTGKEVVARAIHAASGRSDKPFVPINCGAIPSELLESELFGHEKGAFTGALNARKGRFELAEGGTIFLDEIGDMNPLMQVKLLRVLQERCYERVGSAVTQRCNVRIIAATHRNLEESITRGTFREDLYYRLNVVPVEMPPLRERIDDLPSLIASLARRVSDSHRVDVRFQPETINALRQYRWPGNVRELANLIERVAVQCAGEPITIDELPLRYQPVGWVSQPRSDAELPPLVAPWAATPATTTAVPPLANTAIAPPPTAVDENGERQALLGRSGDAADVELPAGGMDLRAYMESLEQRLILKALSSANGTVAHAANLLGLRRTTLVEKLRKYGINASAPA
jgi:sigma-54 specific flagellar transcriptional regulator A